MKTEHTEACEDYRNELRRAAQIEGAADVEEVADVCICKQADTVPLSGVKDIP